jgi:predicted RNA-binding protein YlqC (UPF0109 family)
MNYWLQDNTKNNMDNMDNVSQQYIEVHDDDMGYVIGRNKSNLKYIQTLLKPEITINYYDHNNKKNTKIFSIRGVSKFVDVAVIYFLRIKEKLYEKQRKNFQKNCGYGYSSNESFEQINYQELEPKLPWLNEVETDVNYQQTVSTIHYQDESTITDNYNYNQKNWDDDIGYNTLYNDYYFDYSNF